MKNVALDNGERFIALLVTDDPEQIYKHKNQVIAVTNKRLLFSRLTKVTGSSLEDCYTVFSIPLREVASVRNGIHLAVGGAVAGVLLVFVGLYVAHGGIKGELIGPGVVTIPYVAIPAGLAFLFGPLRRSLTFKTSRGTFKWISQPFALRKTASIASEVSQYFTLPRTDELSGDESWLAIESEPELRGDILLGYHYLLLVLMPYVTVVWGIVKIVRGQKRSGWILLIASICWIALFNLVIHYLVS